MTIREVQMRATAIVLFCASLCPCALCWSQTGRPVEALPNVNESYQLDYAEDFPALAGDNRVFHATDQLPYAQTRAGQ